MTLEKPLAAHQKLFNGADHLIKTIKSPRDFLLFLTDGLNWLHTYTVNQEKYNRSKDHHYSLIMIIESIAAPWFEGGPDVVNNVAEGFEVVCDYCGADGMRELNNSILVAFGKYSENIDWDSRTLQEYLRMINALVDVFISMKEYEMESEYQKSLPVELQLAS